MRTLEKMSTRLPLHSPLFLLGLFRRRLVDGRSKCCSRACLFCRMSPLAMAAAMAPNSSHPNEPLGRGCPPPRFRAQTARNSRLWMSSSSPGHSPMAAAEAERVRSVWPNARVPNTWSLASLSE